MKKIGHHFSTGIQPLVSVVIVTRDRKAELRKCLQAVFAQNYKNIEVLVIDNQSVDGTVEMLVSEFPAVNLIRLDRNLGCPGARNVGALNASGEILFFLDDDCIIDPDAIDNALPYFMSDDRLAVVTPQIIEPETGRPPLIAGDSIRYTHDFTGVSAIRRTVFDTFGLYPSDFLYGAEESDLSIRILNGNGHILYVPQVKIFHYPTRKRKHNWEMEQSFQNAFRVLLKYAPLERIMVGILVKPLTFLPIAIHKRSLWGWIKASTKIPIFNNKIFGFWTTYSVGMATFFIKRIPD